MINKSMVRQKFLFLLIPIIMICLQISCSAGGVTFNVVFDQAAGLKPGAPLVYRGIPLGEVVEEKITSSGTGVVVTVRIDNEYKELIRTSATFCIESSSIATAEKHLRVEIWNVNAPPIADGQVLEGANSQASCWLQDAGGFIEQKFRLGELNMKTSVSESGVTAREFVLDRGQWIPTEWALGDILPGAEAGWAQQEIVKEQSIELRTSQQVDSPEQLRWHRSNIGYVREESLFYVDYFYEEEFLPGEFEVIAPTDEAQPSAEVGWFDVLCGLIVDPDQCDLAKDIWTENIQPIVDEVDLSGLVPLEKIPTRITLTLPGKMQEANTDFMVDGTATWEVTAVDLNQGFVIHAQSRQIRTGMVAGVGGGILLLIIVAIIFIFMRQRPSIDSRTTINGSEDSIEYDFDYDT